VSGHGHVTPNPNGLVARCGGPAICKVCQKEYADSGLPYFRPGIMSMSIVDESSSVDPEVLKEIMQHELRSGAKTYQSPKPQSELDKAARNETEFAKPFVLQPFEGLEIMAYNYAEIRPRLFTDEGQRQFIKVRDKAHALLAQAGSFRMDKVIGVSGDSWTTLACVDRLVELGEIVQLPRPDAWSQFQVFTLPEKANV